MGSRGPSGQAHPPTLTIDARTITDQFTGIGRYALSLLDPLLCELTGTRAVVFTTRRGEPLVRAASAGRAEVEVTHPISDHPRSDWWLHATLPRLLADRRVAVHFSCANYLPIRSGGARHVVTIHDLVPYRHPEVDPPRFVVFLRAMLRLAAARADRVITVSEAMARELTTFLGISPERIRVVHNGLTPGFAPVGPEEVERRLADEPRLAGIRRPYVLSVGARIPRKNFSRLVCAVARARRRGLPHQLVIAGPPGIADPEIRRAIDRSGSGDSVHLLDYPDDTLLHLAYAACDLFVYPSLYEGFGIPVLEAMACGVPVVAAATEAVSEVGGEVVPTFDPTDLEAIAGAVERGLTDAVLRARQSVEGPRRAALFTWAEAARRTGAAIEELL